MSDIVLSASVRQNLLSLQSTADLLATTQNRLATGNKVTRRSTITNSSPPSRWTRSSDINNLLDSIGNGVQVLQAANTGITSLQKLVDSAKSVANQALQATVGYSSKSSVTTDAINGVTADNLLGTGAPVDATSTGPTRATTRRPPTPPTPAAAPSPTPPSDRVHQRDLHGRRPAHNSDGGDQRNRPLCEPAGGACTAPGHPGDDSLTVNGETITFHSGAAADCGSGTRRYPRSTATTETVTFAAISHYGRRLGPAAPNRQPDPRRPAHPPTSPSPAEHCACPRLRPPARRPAVGGREQQR